jgi:excinuclease UvrABC nuclease subunit
MIRQDFDKLKFPETPGVYAWRDAEGKILYIGKAPIPDLLARAACLS